MTILFMDGFDYYSADVPYSTRWTPTNNGFDDAGATGRFGGKALASSNGNTNKASFGLGALQSSISFGFNYKLDTASSSNRALFYLRNASEGVQCSLHINGTTKKIQLVRGTFAGSNILAESTNPLINDTWHHIGVEFVRNSSTGTVNLYIDGVLEDSVTGVNTGSYDINAMEYEAFGNFGSSASLLDDLYVVSGSTWLGERRVEFLSPGSDTVQKDFTADTGSDNYARVDDVPMDGDTSYVFADVIGDEDQYNMADLSTTPANIDALQVVIVARKDDAATRTLAPILVSGSTTDVGDDVGMTSGYKAAVQIYETDPDTSAAWTASGVNAIKAGMRVTA